MQCLVTDRRRLCPDVERFDEVRERLVEQAQWAVRTGIDIVQAREPDLDTADLVALVRALVGLSRGSGTRILVNDRVDVALACGADGVHLRQDSLPADAVRRIAPADFLISRSVHDVAGALAAGPVDYLIAGTVFPTRSKPIHSPLLGLDGLAEIVRHAAMPVLAIGGITRERLDDIAATGAAGIAGIGLFIPSFDRFETPS